VKIEPLACQEEVDSFSTFSGYSNLPTFIQKYILYFKLVFLLVQQPPVGQGLLIHEVSRLHTTTHHSRYDSSGQVISLSQTPPPDKRQHSQQADIHVPGGI